jgi:NhaA family Na+:H+ antiporter
MQKENIIQRFIKDESFSGILLFVATIAAVVVANSPIGASYFHFWHTDLGVAVGEHRITMDLLEWINDGLMALFFLMVGLEIKREMIIGELSSVQKASFPIVAAIGGMVVPALIYVAFNIDNPKGFGIPMATDIAFALGVLMLLGDRVNPALKLFLVALAVVDDLGAVAVVATVYTNEIHYQYFLYAGLIYLLIWVLNFRRVTVLLPYLFLGVVLWFFVHSIGIHATIAGVLLAFAIPIKSKLKEKDFLNKTQEAIDEFGKNADNKPVLNHNQIEVLENMANSYDKVQNPLVRLEHHLHGLSAFLIMPLFAFANAGVILNFSSISEHYLIVLGVVLGLVIGKPIGIFGFTYLAHKVGIVKKPEDLSWAEVVAVGVLGGIGFTMSIFITNLAFSSDNIISAVKLGIFIASFVAGIIAVLLILKHDKSKKAS